MLNDSRWRGMLPAVGISIVLAPLLTVPATASAAPGSAGGNLAASTVEDEDAFINLRARPGYSFGKGTGVLNQNRYTTGGRVTKSVATGWLTVYGLAPNSKHVLFVGAGKCSGNHRYLGTLLTFTTDRRGGWQGRLRFNLGTRSTWIVRGKHHLSLTAGSTMNSPVRSCGKISDDADIPD